MDKRCECHNIDDTVWYEAAMITTFPGVFDNCDDNYDVEEVLRQAGVLLPHNQTDTESCALVVYFDNAVDGREFSKRLHDYIHVYSKETV